MTYGSRHVLYANSELWPCRAVISSGWYLLLMLIRCHLHPAMLRWCSSSVSERVFSRCYDWWQRPVLLSPTAPLSQCVRVAALRCAQVVGQRCHMRHASRHSLLAGHHRHHYRHVAAANAVIWSSSVRRCVRKRLLVVCNHVSLAVDHRLWRRRPDCRSCPVQCGDLFSTSRRITFMWRHHWRHSSSSRCALSHIYFRSVTWLEADETSAQLTHGMAC